MTIDFRKVVAQLRINYQTLQPYRTEEQKTIVAHDAFFAADRELAIQSFCYLFDHLLQHEQGRDAIVLAAFSVPHGIRTDARVQACMDRARELAEPMKDPLSEQAFNYIDLVHAAEDNAIKCLDYLPNRARYWLSIARLSRAKTAMEFGTGCGSNVMQCAILEPSIHWIGVDVSEPQVKYCREQAARLGFANVEYYTMAEAKEKILTADCVALLDVLEHTVFPDEMLAAFEYCVAKDGTACITTPNGAWSPWSDNINGTVPGAHVAVESLPSLVARIEPRGTILDARVIPGTPVEGNSNAAVAYAPSGENLPGAAESK